MSFDAFVKDKVDAELQREAGLRAARFREQNPDTAEATDADLNFDEAYDAALKRATIGASPKAGAHAREVYKQAFNSALA